MRGCGVRVYQAFMGSEYERNSYEPQRIFVHINPK
jgi:hypothetical protein